MAWVECNNIYCYYNDWGDCLKNSILIGKEGDCRSFTSVDDIDRSDE